MADVEVNFIKAPEVILLPPLISNALPLEIPVAVNFKMLPVLIADALTSSAVPVV